MAEDTKSAAPAGLDIEALDAEVAAELDAKVAAWDDEVAQEMDSNAPEAYGADNDEPEQQESGGTLSQIWEWTKGAAKGAYEDVSNASLKDLAKTGGRAIAGVAQEAFEVGKSAAGGDLDQEAFKRTAEAFHPELKQQEDDTPEFIDWYEKNVKVVDFQPQDIDKWMGPQTNRTLGVVEELGKFAAGFALSGGALKAAGVAGKIERIGAAGGKVAKAVQSLTHSAAQGLVNDTLFIDADGERLSNIIQSGPEWLQNPITDYLAADPDDSFAEKKFKSALEGLMVGTLIDGTLASLKALKGIKSEAKGIGEVVTPAAPSEIDPIPVNPPPAPKGTNIERIKGKYLVDVDGQDLGAFDSHEEAVNAAAKASLGNKLDGFSNEVSTQGRVGVQARLGKYEVVVDGQPIGPGFKTREEANSIAATAEAIQANNRRPRGTLTDDDLEAFRAGDGSKVRINYAQSPEEVLAQVERLSQMDIPRSVVGRTSKPKPVKSEALTSVDRKKFAEDIFRGKEGNEAIQAARDLLGDERFDARLKALQIWTHAQAAEIDRLAKAATENPNNALAVAELGKALDALDRMVGPQAADGLAHKAKNTFVDGAIAKPPKEMPEKAPSSPVETPEGAPKGNGAGAPTDGSRIDEKAVSGAVKAAEKETLKKQLIKAFKGLTPEQVREKAAMIEAAQGDPGKITEILNGPSMADAAKIADPVVRRSFGQYVKAWFYNAILSATHPVNIIGNLGEHYLKSTEMMISGALQFDKRAIQEGWETGLGLFVDASENLQMARRAFKEGGPILDRGAVVSEAAGHEFGQWDFSSAWSWFNANSRLLGAEDEFFKQSGYRARVRAEIFRKAREEGITDMAELQRRYKEGFKLQFDEADGAINPDGIAFARDITFTNELKGGFVTNKIVRPMAEASSESFLVGMNVPVVRTPWNAFRYGIAERNPLLAPFVKRWREDFKAGGKRRADALAKVAVGTSFYVMGAGLAANGIITGRGPKDPKAKADWESQGWQADSVKVGKEYVSYKSLPSSISVPLKIMADIIEMRASADDRTADEMSYAVVASLTAAAADRTFLSSLHDFLEGAASGDENKLKRYLASKATSFVPAAYKKSGIDDQLRMTQGLVDELAAQVPGWSNTLPAVRNVFNEPRPARGRTFNPLVSSTVKDPELLVEMMELGKGFSMPSTTAVDGKLDLTDTKWAIDGKTPYEYLLEQMNAPVEGKTLKEELIERIQSPDYKELSKKGGFNKAGGPAFTQLNGIIERRMAAAEKAMWAKYQGLNVVKAFTEGFLKTGNKVGPELANPAVNQAMVDWVNEVIEGQ